jgi:hypothetical protein
MPILRKNGRLRQHDGNGDSFERGQAPDRFILRPAAQKIWGVGDILEPA